MSYFTDPGKLTSLLGNMAEGTLTTIALFCIALVASLPLGFLSALGSISRVKPVRWLVNLYVLIMRGTPLMLQIIFIYFGLGMIGIGLPRFLAAVVALVVNYTAYFSEIFRGGIQSIETGQFEAADVLGMNYSLTMRRIVLPQVFKRVMPSVGNEVINLIKDTALVYTIGISELLRVGQTSMMRDGSLLPLFIAGAFYLLMNALVTKGLRLVEKRFNYYR